MKILTELLNTVRLLVGVTRIEVIDETGRVYTKWDTKVFASVQDGGRTLKLFIGRCDCADENLE